MLLCWLSHVFVFKLTSIMLSVLFLYCYAKCCIFLSISWLALCWVLHFFISMLSAVVLSFTFFIFKVSAIMLSVVFIYCYAEFRYAECRMFLSLSWLALCWELHFFIAMLSAFMLNVLGSTVVRPSYTCFVIIRLLKWSVGYLKLDEKKYLGRESSLKGNDHYNWPPYTNQFISAALYKKYNFLFSIQAILMWRSIVLSFPLQ